MARVSVAAAQYRCDTSELDAVEAKIAAAVAEAADLGADIVVFPEYAALEFAAAGRTDFDAVVERIGRLVPEIDSLHQMLARRHGVHVLAASVPARGGDGTLRNVARLFAPGGAVGRQEKLLPSPFERETWGISGGGPACVFRTTVGMIGVAVGYDVEFPLVVRAMAEAGAAIILAPSFTATAHGFHRVRIAAAARALENQCFVVRAAIVGPSPLPAAFAWANGTAGIHAPPDGPFPDDGVLAEGRPGDSGWVRADLDLDALDGVRAAGDTLNHAHWAEQGILTAPPAEVVDLT